ncbi:putative pentatricopeptide [Rosa chinensis]|uniref:Putative pentatricopeptide n=1 Tax=Rosa chinensis TaxID=74649 RepID=A0A2P6QH17_ROSCH|nr:pentatricopeptide repeat-containing protein At2g28050 [Rosa chinensis]XP_040363298.1 pentatricopeptide repeat-containing protein At2g28050 [Rosa chinensis]PRQ33469.1 putative pentatricopeptide [Rosa chinensis]
MSFHNVLRTLKTVKVRTQVPFQEFCELISAIPSPSAAPKPLNPTTISLLSKLNPNSLHLILSEPTLSASKCLVFFNFLLKNQSFISFKLDLQAHLTLICRLIRARKITLAEHVFKSISVDQNSRYPFRAIASCVEVCCLEPVVEAKLFNLMLKVYSDIKNFDGGLEAFDYIKSIGIRIDERTYNFFSVAMNRAGEVEKGIDFLYRLLYSGTGVSVYCLTAVVEGMCRNGEITRSRELVQEMAGRGIKPNIITFNIMVEACAKRWNFSELDLILPLMEKEGLAFDVKTYEFLIDGFTSSGKLEEAERLVGEMHDKGLKVKTHVYNLIINSYCRKGFLEGALSLFSKMAERSIFQNADTYWFLINGICKVGEMGLAMQYVNEMQNKGFELDNLDCNILADGFRSKGMANELFELQALMEKKSSKANGFKQKKNGYDLTRKQPAVHNN